MTYSIDPAAIAKKLKALRVARGKTIVEMSDETGIGRTALTNYELGIRVPRDEVKLRLAHYFETSVDDLFFSA